MSTTRTEKKTRRGPRGKYFTEVIRKQPLRVLIATAQGQVEGVLHVHPDHRLSDEINEGPPFLAITDARISRGNETTETSFLAVNRDRVLWIMPHDEIEGDAHHDG